MNTILTESPQMLNIDRALADPFVQKLVSVMPVGLLFVSRNYKLLDWNDIAMEYFGATEEQLLHQSLPEVWWSGLHTFNEYGDPEEGRGALIREAMETGNVIGPRVTGLQRDDQPVRWVLGSAVPFKDSDGEVRFVMGTMVDITKQRESEGYLGVLARLGQRAQNSTTLTAVLEDCCLTLKAMLETKTTKVLEILTGGDEFLFRAGEGWSEGVVGRAHVPTTADGMCGYALRHATPVIVTDLRTDRRFVGQSILHQHGLLSGIMCNIGPFSRPWGVLAVHDDKPRAYSARDLHVLEQVAQIVWHAVARFGEVDGPQES